MRKILLVSNTEWYLYNFRRNLALFLRKTGAEVVMVSPSGPYAAKLQEMGFRWIPWEVGRKTLAPWREIAALMQLREIYRRESPDLVHHHTIKPCLYGSIAARQAGVPGIVNSITGRGYVFLGNDSRANLLRRIVEPVYRYAFRAPNCAAIFENEGDRQFFIDRRLIDPARAHLVESVGVDPAQFFPQPELPEPPVVLFASRMLWDKGVGVLVDASRLLKARLPVRVVLAGDPDPGNPASVPLENLRNWEAEGLVEWWGFQDDMNAVYNRSHIVTLPSMYGEGVPTVLIEGAACGRPLVTTQMPGCQDVVQDGINGWLVPPGDAGALANALEKLVRDPTLRQQMGAAARRLVLEKYTIDQVNTATLAIYHKVLPTL